MYESLNDAQWVGLSLVFVGMALIGGMLLRHAVPWLSAFYIPASVLAGFLLLLTGPQVLGALSGGWSLLPHQVLGVLAVLPRLMINVVFAGIMIGKTLPP